LDFDFGLAEKLEQMTLPRMNMEDCRWHILNMDDNELIRYAQACRQMTDPKNPVNKYHVDLMYEFQLVECGTEWRRRHPNAERPH
jgi:hypothetical protein